MGCMRIREWYSYHFPELIKIVPENALYAKVVKLIKNRKELSQDMFDQLEAILMDSARAQAVIDASKSSMGMDISPIDLLNIDMFARCKVKFNVNKSDNMIIQSIALLDQLDKDINTFCMRIREWYSYHFPELIKIVPENALYAKVV